MDCQRRLPAVSRRNTEIFVSLDIPIWAVYIAPLIRKSNFHIPFPHTYIPIDPMNPTAHHKEVFRSFIPAPVVDTIIPYGSGHINDTYLVTLTGGGRYILQRINQLVFKNPVKLMENVSRATTHLRAKLMQRGEDLEAACLTVIPADDGLPYCRDDEGNVWRVYLFIPDAVSYDLVDTPEKARIGGLAFGKFQYLLADLPGPALHETIPDFHHLGKRLQAFETAVELDVCRRAATATDHIDFVRRRAEKMQAVLCLYQDGKIPTRIIHNDTKFNNVLLCPNGTGFCVIDLDTVMNGCIHYDFGDAIRTAATTAAEDEPDCRRVGLNLELFAAYTHGYLKYAGRFITPVEKEHLAFSCQAMTFIIGLRFLTDYLVGDTYFKIHYPEHNLVRARAQFALVLIMEKQFDRMQRIVAELAGK